MSEKERNVVGEIKLPPGKIVSAEEKQKAQAAAAGQTGAAQMPLEPMKQPVTWQHNRYFTLWMKETNCSFIVTSYKAHRLLCVGLDPKGEISIWVTQLMRPMGIGLLQGADGQPDQSTLYCSNMGHIFRYENKGVEEDKEHGKFDANYYAQLCYLGGDIDIHDLRPTKKGVFYCSALFNCVVKPSQKKTFQLYWRPPWIKTEDDHLPAEDRCHVNGLCCIDGEPRYVTAACQGNVVGAWRDTFAKGVVYDLKEDRVVVGGLISPHSPQYYQGKLWLLESGTGYFGYCDLEKGVFVKKTFVPGFLRGMSFVDNYAVICGSHDRHDNSFNKNPLGKRLVDEGINAKCGLFVVSLETFDVLHNLEFNTGVNEIYDITCLKGVRRPKMVDINETRLINTFHL